MSFSFSGKRMNVGVSLTHHAAETCENISSKYGYEFSDISIIMGKNGFLYNTELSVKASDGTVFHATAEAKEPYVSFDSAVQKLATQLKKQKSIANDFDKTSIRYSYDIDRQDEAETDIVTETVDVITLSPRDAAKMLLEQDKALIVFKNQFTACINVVYKRPDGKVCVLDYKG